MNYLTAEIWLTQDDMVCFGSREIVGLLVPIQNSFFKVLFLEATVFCHVDTDIQSIHTYWLNESFLLSLLLFYILFQIDEFLHTEDISYSIIAGQFVSVIV